MSTPTRSLDDRLARALIDIADGLDLGNTLDRALTAALELTGARYGALGVLDGYGGLSEFRFEGMSDEEADAIGTLPRGRGLLGHLVVNPEPLRLAHLAEHPAATGFPDGHPAMDSFLGVPIRAGGTVFGNLYLTEKEGGFDAADEDCVMALASAAGVAVHNAQLFEAARLGAQWQAAAAEMANAALRGDDGGTVLELLAQHAREVTSADIALVASPIQGELMVEVVVADDPVDPERAQSICETLSRHAKDNPEMDACLDGLDTAVLSDVQFDWTDGPVTATQMACFPVTTDTRNVATLGLVWLGPEAVVTPDALAAVQGMAVQAAVSLTMDSARVTEQKLLVFRDRDRIARDLHDLVVQRLFAGGVSLRVLGRTGDLPDEARERIDDVGRELDATIAQIRSTIFNLKEGFTGTWQVSDRLEAEAERMTAALGFTPALHVDAELTTLDAEDILADTVAVVREALSNVARHSGATRADVRVWFRDGWYGVEVSDDGVGLGDSARRSGVANLADRAQERGGTCELRDGVGGGTVLTWTVPLHALPD